MQSNRRFSLNPNVQGLLVLAVLLVVTGVFLYNNREGQQVVARPQPANTPTASSLQDWQVGLQADLAALPSLTPTQAASLTPLPTLTPRLQSTVQVVAPQSLSTVDVAGVVPSPTQNVVPTSQSVAVAPQNSLPTSVAPDFVDDATPVPLPTGIEIGLPPNLDDNTERFQLPPEQVPLSLHPFDHFYLTRPLDVSSNTEYLFYYPYGSSGAGFRVHHGIDIPNPVGRSVLAAGSGTVVWADITYETEIDGDLEVYASYGNVVVIEHDFGWAGQSVWTLYAHLEEIFVRPGQTVVTGDPIGVVGTTGNVTGPHVHFEVRVGRNSYYSTRNPIMWMAPYIDHGIVAGRVVDVDGRFVDNAIVQLTQDGRITDRTTTYNNPFEEGKRFWQVVPDDNWRENFAMGDIPAGQYELVVQVNDDRFFENVTVRAGTTAFVNIQLDQVATPQPFDEALPENATRLPPTAIVPTQANTAIPSATPSEAE